MHSVLAVRMPVPVRVRVPVHMTVCVCACACVYACDRTSAPFQRVGDPPGREEKEEEFNNEKSRLLLPDRFHWFVEDEERVDRMPSTLWLEVLFARSVHLSLHSFYFVSAFVIVSVFCHRERI